MLPVCRNCATEYARGNGTFIDKMSPAAVWQGCGAAGGATNGQKRYLKSHSVERVPFVNTGALSRAATCGASAVAEKQTGLRCIRRMFAHV